MAPFNKRQIGYIQAIAGRQQHVTLIAKHCDYLLSNTITDQEVAQKSDTVTPTFEVLNTGRSDEYPVDGAVFADAIKGAGIGGDKDYTKSLLLHTWELDQPELGFDSRSAHNNDKLEYQDFDNLQLVGHFSGKKTNLNMFDAPVEGSYEFGGAGLSSTAVATGHVEKNEIHIPSNKRATPDGFLNSTDVKFRFTLPTEFKASSGSSGSDNPMGQTHYEFRWIVFRNKRPTFHNKSNDDTTHGNMEAIREGRSFRNYTYDLFMGQNGRKRGLAGYTTNAKLDQDRFVGVTPGERYSGKLVNTDGDPDNSTDVNLRKYKDDDDVKLTVDDLMTMRLNRDDYVVLKDVRFFLGKEHGKSHFEDHLHWDWNDPIDTPYSCVLESPTLNDKNYRWKMMIIGTSGGKDPIEVLSTVRATTKMESG